MNRGAVAGQQEARQGRGEHHRIAHDHVGRGLADLVLGPGHRHDADGAGEVGNVEGDIGAAVGTDGDDAGEERQRRPGRGIALQRGAGVAAGADLAACALHAVDQVAVEIADFRRQRALAEIVIVGRRRLVIGEIENADIDRGNRDPRLVAGFEPLDLDRDVQRGVRPQQRRRLQIDGERLRRAVDGEPLHADGAAGHALRRRIERPAQGGDDIGARAPIGADRHLHLGNARLLHVGALAGKELVADHIQRETPGVTRRDSNGHRVAGPVFALVERGFQHIRRVGAGVDVPAGIERHRRGRAVRLRRSDIELIAAEIHRQRDMARLVARGVERTVGEARGGLDRLEMPRAVALIELIVGFDAQQLVVQALGRDRGAVGRNDHDVERGAGAVGQRAAREQRLDADHVAARGDRQRDLVLDGAAARLRHAHGDAGFERMRARRQLVDIDVEARLAGVVGRRQAIQRLLHGGDVFAVEAELITGKAGALGRHGDVHVAFEIEAPRPARRRGSGRQD